MTDVCHTLQTKGQSCHRLKFSYITLAAPVRGPFMSPLSRCALAQLHLQQAKSLRRGQVNNESKMQIPADSSWSVQLWEGWDFTKSHERVSQLYRATIGLFREKVQRAGGCYITGSEKCLRAAQQTRLRLCCGAYPPPLVCETSPPLTARHNAACEAAHTRIPTSLQVSPHQVHCWIWLLRLISSQHRTRRCRTDLRTSNLINPVRGLKTDHTITKKLTFTVFIWKKYD